MKKQLLGVGLEFHMKESHKLSLAGPASDFPCCQRSGRPVYKRWLRDAAGHQRCSCLLPVKAVLAECAHLPPRQQQLLSVTASRPSDGRFQIELC